MPETMPDKYVHALGWRWLNRLYDPLIRLTMPEKRFKRRLIDRARIEPDDWVLDLGCGTGTLMLSIRGWLQTAHLVGVDGDFTILEIACEKARRAGASLALVTGNAVDLPFGSHAFDRVLTTLVFHHLDTSQKTRALRELWRVLQPGGELHIADWGRPHTRLMRLAARPVAAFDGRGSVDDNLAGRIREFCSAAGFEDVSDDERWPTLFGTLTFYRAVKPGGKVRGAPA